MTLRMHILSMAILFLVATAPFVSSAQTTNETALSAAAQAAVKKGVSAAKQQEWTVAIRYFNEARQAAPGSPVPLINLGLAEAQLPGHELRAICWFEAYLALVPNAVNAPAVRQQISDLEIRAEGNADKIIEMLKVLVGQMPSTDFYAVWGANADLAGLLASSGDLDAAEQIVQNQSNKQIQDHAREGIVEAFVKLKRIPDAIKEANQTTDNYSSDRADAYQSIFSAQVAAGLFADAKISATNFMFQGDHRLELAEAEYKAGKQDDAAALFRDERELIDKETDLDLRESELADFAVAQYKIGEHEKADAIFQQIKEYIDGITGKDKDSHRMYTLIRLATSEDNIGRRSDAIYIIHQAEEACLTAQKAHEQGMGIAGNEFMLWNADIYGLENYNGAEALMRRLYSGDAEEQHSLEIELAAKKASSIADLAIASAKAVKDASIKTLADNASSPSQRGQAWSDYIKGCLSAPLYTTDFKVTMAGLVSFTPSTDNVKSQEIFDHVKQPAEDLIDRLNDIHELEGSSARVKAAGDDDFTVQPSGGTVISPPHPPP